MSWVEDISAFSALLDEWTVAEGPMHLARIRCSKLNEEAGEVEEALIAWEGSNPRKEQAESTDLLIKELLDVATAALGAVEHLTGNSGKSGEYLENHCRHLITRLRKAMDEDCPWCKMATAAANRAGAPGDHPCTEHGVVLTAFQLRSLNLVGVPPGSVNEITFHPTKAEYVERLVARCQEQATRLGDMVTESAIDHVTSGPTPDSPIVVAVTAEWQYDALVDAAFPRAPWAWLSNLVGRRVDVVKRIES